MNPDRLFGCLLGTAVGDALGLPYEGLPPRRVGDTTRYHFLFGRGMVSDDTEHACMTLQALWRAGGDVERFRRALARQLRGWVLMLPAGVGLATLRACIRLLIGASPERSGVFSAGNGPVMRAAIIGCFYAQDPVRRVEFVRAASRITHTDPKAEEGAQIVALAASYRASGRPLDDRFLEEARLLVKDDVWCPILSGPTLKAGDRGIGGYVVSTVEAALAVCIEHPTDFTVALSKIVSAGGDTDTTAAIVGGILGASGSAIVPVELRSGLLEWPRDVAWMSRLSSGAVRTFWPGVFLRNIAFLIVVLAHGFLRLVPRR